MASFQHTFFPEIYEKNISEETEAEPCELSACLAASAAWPQPARPTLAPPACHPLRLHPPTHPPACILPTHPAQQTAAIMTTACSCSQPSCSSGGRGQPGWLAGRQARGARPRAGARELSLASRTTAAQPLARRVRASVASTPSHRSGAVMAIPAGWGARAYGRKVRCSAVQCRGGVQGAEAWELCCSAAALCSLSPAAPSAPHTPHAYTPSLSCHAAAGDDDGQRLRLLRGRRPAGGVLLAHAADHRALRPGLWRG